MKYSVKLNGIQYEVEVEKITDDFRAMTKAEVSGEVLAAPVAAPSPAPVSAKAAPAVSAAPVAAAGSSSGCQVLSPMPGKVLEVIAAKGQSVRAGETLLLIEAMKMENEIVAPRDGVVDSIPVKGGDVVDTDAILAVLR